MNTQELINLFQPVIIQIATPKSTGTGYYLKEYGVIVTNNHVIAGSTEIVISGKSFKKYLSKVIFTDPKHDIAFILPPEGADMPQVDFETQIPIKEGDTVIAIGHPYGLNYTATQGIVSKAERLQNGLSYIQIDAAINPGNSGGPLVNTHGHIVGMNTFIIGSDNLGFALPVSYVMQALEDYKPEIGKAATRCPSCSNIVTEENIEDKYCPFCGAEVSLPVSKEEYKPSGASLVIEDIIAKLGKDVKLSRGGPYAWEFTEGSALIKIFYNENGFIVGDSFLASLPKANIGALYEYLLRENYNLKNLLLSVSKQDVLLSFLIYDEYLTPEGGYATFKELLEKSDYYDTILVEQFGALPRKEQE